MVLFCRDLSALFVECIVLFIPRQISIEVLSPSNYGNSKGNTGPRRPWALKPHTMRMFYEGRHVAPCAAFQTAPLRDQTRAAVVLLWLVRRTDLRPNIRSYPTPNLHAIWRNFGWADSEGIFNDFLSPLLYSFCPPFSTARLKLQGQM